MPRCATCMPSQLRGWANNPPRVARTRSKTPNTTAVAIHVANANPKATGQDQRPNAIGVATPITNATAAGMYNRLSMALILADFQLATGPTAINNSAGTISGTKTALKYGGPTESLPNPNASIKSGYRVPRIIEPAATASNTLFTSNKDSRESKSNRPPSPTFGARRANKNKEVPTTTVKSSRMNTPRRGSVAKACTDVSTPERTRNAPNKDKEKVLMASNTVQLLKPPRFSVTANE